MRSEISFPSFHLLFSPQIHIFFFLTHFHTHLILWLLVVHPSLLESIFILQHASNSIWRFLRSSVLLPLPLYFCDKGWEKGDSREQDQYKCNLFWWTCNKRLNRVRSRLWTHFRSPFVPFGSLSFMSINLLHLQFLCLWHKEGERGRKVVAGRKEGVWKRGGLIYAWIPHLTIKYQLHYSQCMFINCIQS